MPLLGDIGGLLGKEAGNALGGFLGLRRGGSDRRNGGRTYIEGGRGEYVLPRSVHPTKAQKRAVRRLNKRR
jgi:hypothetical protein